MSKKIIKNIEDTYYNKTPKKRLKKLNFKNTFIQSEMFLDLTTGIIRSSLKTPEILEY